MNEVVVLLQLQWNQEGEAKSVLTNDRRKGGVQIDNYSNKKNE